MKKIIVFSCFLSFGLPTAYSQSFDAEQLFAFAESLFQEGDYLNAVNEYKRYLFLYPKADKSDLAQFSLAAAYQNDGKLGTAIKAYQTLIDTYPQSPLIERAKSNIAQCQLLQGDRSTAIASLRQFLSDYPESDLAPRAQFIIAMIQMDSKKWDEASRAWQQVIIKYPRTPFAAISDRLARSVQHGNSLPHRSSTVAGLLSTAIPGLGQMYSGRFSDGLQSLIVVGAIAGGTAYYIDRQRYAVAIPVGLIGLFFHAGNIYGGIQSAKAFNLRQENHFLDELRTQIYQSNLFGASQPPPTHIPLVRWRSRF